MMLRYFLLTIVLTSLTSQTAFPYTQEEAEKAYPQLIRFVNPNRVRTTIETLASSNRLGGPTGKTLEYLKKNLSVFGELYEEKFTLTIPDQKDVATIFVGDTAIPAVALWPNLVRTSQCDLNGELIYVGDGSLKHYNGKKVERSIVLMDFNSGQNWQIAASLGASAIIFIGASGISRSESEAKWSGLPLNVPRFLVEDKDATYLLQNTGKHSRVLCNQKWVDQEFSNLFVYIPGSHPTLSKEWIIISAYTDAVSVTPSIAPGADQAAGVATLIEIGHLLKKLPTKRSVILLLTSGHFQAMQGLRNFIENRINRGWPKPGPTKINAWFTLDLSTKSDRISSMAISWWLDYRWENFEPVRPISQTLRERMPQIAKAMRRPAEELFFDGVNNPDGRDWRNNTPGKFALEAELINLAGFKGITLMTSGDLRELQDTPLDTYENIHLGNLLTQIRVLSCFFYHLSGDTQNETLKDQYIMPFRGANSPKRMSLMGGFATIEGRVLRYQPQKGFLPNVPVPNTLVVTSNLYRNYKGVRGDTIVRSNPTNAHYKIIGVPPVTTWVEERQRWTSILAFGFDESGNINIATDFGMQGSGLFETLFPMTTTYREVPVVVFYCQTYEFFGFIDPLSMTAIKQTYVFDARNDGYPQQISILIDRALYHWDRPLGSYVENAAVLFLQPHIKFKLVGLSGISDIRMTLTNSTKQKPTGEGYDIEDSNFIDKVLGGRFRQLTFHAAKDMISLNEWRLSLLKKYRIISPEIIEMHEQSKKMLLEAQNKQLQKNYSESEKLARSAWAFALRTYPVLQGTTKDLLNGLVFYLALLIPFAFFAERLLFGAKKLSSQILIGSLLFSIVFIAFRLLHPAFELSGNTFMIFVAFILGTLSLIVMTLLLGRFERAFREGQEAAAKTGTSVQENLGTIAAALSISLSSMRRRKTRTFLTCITLTTIAFTILSFTSIVPSLRFNEVDAPGKPSYTGILFRSPTLQALEDNTYESLKTEFGNEANILRRAWYYGSTIGVQSVISIKHDNKKIECSALLGIDPGEEYATFSTKILRAGRFFHKNEKYAILLPLSMAENLGIRRIDVGKTYVDVMGNKLLVVGIFEELSAQSLRDLDDESPLPADFAASQRLMRQGQAGNESFRQYVRLNPATIAIIPTTLAIALGADIRTIAAVFKSTNETRTALSSLLPRTNLNLYAAVQENNQMVNKRFSAVASSQARGIENIIIPVIIAMLIVMNTMIASVMERRKEIGILSAIGLSPRQISSLFFIESLVYAIIGATGGYLIAQIVAKIVSTTNLFPELYLNLSSANSMIASCILLAVVLLSTIYPARMARKLAVSAETEEWAIEPSQEESWQIQLPFTVSQQHAEALARFYYRWLQEYEDFTIGDFVTESVILKKEAEHEESYRVSAKCWIAPFDLGVQQQMDIVLNPTEMKGVFSVNLTLNRISGDPEHWINLNKNFIRKVRKQFLVWRALSPHESAVYFAADWNPSPNN